MLGNIVAPSMGLHSTVFRMSINTDYPTTTDQILRIINSQAFQ